jgi:hypothetical protein
MPEILCPRKMTMPPNSADAKHVLSEPTNPPIKKADP